MKNPMIKDAELMKVYELYNNPNMSTGNFKLHCIKLIEESRQPNEQIIRELRNDRVARDQVLTKISNFALKGQGYGVLSR
jgi:hypothetical protein